MSRRAVMKERSRRFIRNSGPCVFHHTHPDKPVHGYTNLRGPTSLEGPLERQPVRISERLGKENEPRPAKRLPHHRFQLVRLHREEPRRQGWTGAPTWDLCLWRALEVPHLSEFGAYVILGRRWTNLCRPRGSESLPLHVSVAADVILRAGGGDRPSAAHRGLPEPMERLPLLCLRLSCGHGEKEVKRLGLG